MRVVESLGIVFREVNGWVVDLCQFRQTTSDLHTLHHSQVSLSCFLG